ncbi:LANO_0C06216g1_1 [Lachancea nothofagi CBS 11611]|uniref:LANO_0C06216g1_1 n=1 Tax=Lachancea nothofagi CBS 11611 TaxID=1266666 RepID=A0A1G4J7U9_9SACH|nr:LANO_0C06216g1_1 [Lachancea nothofagi CBS 11611]
MESESQPKLVPQALSTLTANDSSHNSGGIHPRSSAFSGGDETLSRDSTAKTATTITVPAADATGSHGNIETGHNQELVESTLFLLQETIWNTLVQMRNRESIYDCYSAAKSRYQNQYTCLVHIDYIFKILMNYPAEVLSAMYIPVILRFFKWCLSLQQLPRDLRGTRFIITTKKGIAFLMANWNEYCYNTATLYQAFKALKLLQNLEMALFPQKPDMYTDQPDDEAEDPNWSPLDESQLESLIVSINKNSATSTAPPFSTNDYSNQQNSDIPDYFPLDYSNQQPSATGPSSAPMPPISSTQQQAPQFYGVHQSPLSHTYSEFHEPFTTQPAILNHDITQQQNLDNLFGQTIPEIFQRLNALGNANDDLRRQNNVLSESLRNIKYQLLLLKNNMDNVFPKTPSPTSSKMESSQFQPNLPESIILAQPDPMDTSNIGGNDDTKINLDVGSRASTGYDNLLPYHSSTNAFQFGTELKIAERLTKDEAATVFSSGGRSGTSPMPPMATIVGSSTASNISEGRYPTLRKPKVKVREFTGATLTKGESYQPPLTPEGKSYLVDEDGKLAIVMANDQDSIFGMYNEYYQSLRPQIDSFVNDFGKRNLVHFKKKRTFQKKKAFVQWVERISHSMDIPPEDVLDLIDEVRQKENRSVVWSCNNLGSMKDAFVKHKPEFREAALSDTD